MTIDLNFDKERFAAAIRDAASALPQARPQAHSVAKPATVPVGTPSYIRPLRADTAGSSGTCAKCHGTGRFVGYSGRDIGDCFTCKGTGLTHRGAPTIATKPYPNIRAAFDAVERRGLKKAQITIGDINISLARTGSRNPGALYVKHMGEYVGKMERDKPLLFGVKCHSPQTVVRLLDAIEPDPIAAITAQAKTDADRVAEMVAAGLEPIVPCCCCGIYLTDPESRSRGIGPICAARWGLFGFSMPEALSLDDL